MLLGCVPHSDNPLTNPDKEQIDSSILGTWFWNDKNESGYIHIGLDEKSRLLRVVMLDYDRDRELDVSEFIGHTSSLEGNQYLNLEWVRPQQDEITGYLLLKITVSSDTLGIAFMDREETETAILDGSLAGEVIKSDWSSSVHITERQEKLQAFILRNDKVLFPEMKTIQKLNLPISYDLGNDDLISDTDVVTVKSPVEIQSVQKLPYYVGISADTAGAKALSMNMVVIPPGGQAAAHYHDGFESTVYLLEGRVETRYGKGLAKSITNEAGDFILIPPNVPHQPKNLSQTERAVAIVTRNDPNEQESVVPYSPGE